MNTTVKRHLRELTERVDMPWVSTDILWSSEDSSHQAELPPFI